MYEAMNTIVMLLISSLCHTSESVKAPVSPNGRDLVYGKLWVNAQFEGSSCPNPGEVFVESCNKCVVPRCSECFNFNPSTCQCDRIFRCRPRETQTEVVPKLVSVGNVHEASLDQTTGSEEENHNDDIKNNTQDDDTHKGAIDRFQGPFANTFSDDQCEVIDYRNEISLDQCLTWCETNPACTAVNFNERHKGGSCVRRACPIPISHPTGHETDPAWKGYSHNIAPWLHGGRCGPQHRLPDGRPGQCNPQGIYPCCNSKSGWCGNTKDHCACTDCIDYTKMN